jgi:hypothetical protein
MTNQAEGFVQVGTLFFHVVELLFEPRRHPGSLCYGQVKLLAGCDVFNGSGWYTRYARLTIKKSVAICRGCNHRRLTTTKREAAEVLTNRPAKY